MNSDDLALHLLIDRLTQTDEERRRQGIEYRDLTIKEIERLDSNCIKIEESLKKFARIAEKNANDIARAKALSKGALIAAIGFSGIAELIPWKDIAAMLLKAL